MFHNFQVAGNSANSNASASRNNPKTRRQSSTTHACEECRRRKIRCDGKQPCSHCEWYKHPKLCKYSKKQPRVVPSQRLLDELNTALKSSQKVIQKLFPNTDLNLLGELPRQELVDLINSASSRTPSSGDSPRTNSASDHPTPSRTKSEDNNSVNLESLEQEPSPDANWDESKVGPNGIPPIADDVNALSMNVNRQSSYLGVSSIAAALRVISKINKALEHVIVSSPTRTGHATGSNSPRRYNGIEETLTSIVAPALSQSVLVDAYFNHIHPLIPMIDETRFRVIYSTNERRDASWLALLNMVFALGTIAASTAEDNSHLVYHNRAKQCVDLDMFGNGHIEALQALGLMGGFYLHYESRPNMANAIMGAAMRMACALGLHREYAEGPMENRSDFVKRALLIPREVRRRTWWSLFCLDTWATTTQGRPSLGRTSPAVTALPPSFLGDPPNNTNPGSIDDDDAAVMILCQESTFCKIATRVQDRLAEQPLLPFDETTRFDMELKHWYENLPPMFRPSEKCPERARTARAVLSWRYHNLRLVLHRPLLLNNALRSSLDHNDSPSEEELRSVATCRAIAADTIADIRLQWRPNQMSGWNAVWLLFQASMAPLVTIFAEYNRGNLNEARAAQTQIEQVIALLAQMAEWSITAKKTRVFMVKIYEHSCHMTMQAAQQSAQHAMVTQNQVHALSQLHMDAGPQARQVSPMTQAQSSSMPGHNAMDLQQQQMYHSPLLQSSALVDLPPSSSAMGMMPTHHQQHQRHQQHHGGMSSASAAATMSQMTFMNQDELNAFWNQIMWGEGDMPDFMMDTNFDFDCAPYAGQGGGGPSGVGGVGNGAGAYTNFAG